MIFILQKYKINEMNPYSILEKYYDKHSRQYEILIAHSEQVRNKALEVADKHPELNANKEFIAEAAMLHDIGVFLTNAPKIDCFGDKEYICHGFLGSDIIKKEGFPLHALVCERHTGTGMSLEYIIENNLPLPHRDMRPVSIEEQIICYADKFFSKTKLNKELSVEKIISKLHKYGDSHAQRFLSWHEKFC
ncbi:conserved hypothetical protein [uncultured Paludibacter sp.]|uniref:HD domain-containing protein n=1 Tax=uncultured Paludibacter sp. TaxID=497635 RepID=A0A653AFN0_9BACT|nr:conserved hypothetical protein [uncultured Paludibacter sp.]